MTLATLRAAVDQRTGLAVDAPALNGYINEALAAIAAENDWPWLRESLDFSTIVGTGEYGLPTGFVRARSLSDSSGNRDLSTGRELEDDPGVGASRWWSEWGIDGDKLIVRPVPTAVESISFEYVRSEPVLVADGDLPLLPPQYQGIVVTYATYLVHERAGNEAAAERAWKGYERWRMRMRKATSQTHGPHRIHVRDGSVW